MRYYLDEMFPEALAIAARVRQLDVVSALGLGYTGTSDEAHLLLAADEGRCVVTKNGDDFRRLGEIFREHHLPHAGVLVVSPSLEAYAYAAIVDRLAHWHALYPDGVPAYFFSYL